MRFESWSILFPGKEVRPLTARCRKDCNRVQLRLRRLPRKTKNWWRNVLRLFARKSEPQLPCYSAGFDLDIPGPRASLIFSSIVLFYVSPTGWTRADFG